jgi:hypothetical protein
MAFMDSDLTTAAAAVSFSMLALFPRCLSCWRSLIGPQTVEKYVIGQVLAFLPGVNLRQQNLDHIDPLHRHHRELSVCNVVGDLVDVP